MADSDMNANRGGEAVATSIAFTAIAATFVILRWTARFGVLHNPGIDDYLILISVVRPALLMQRRGWLLSLGEMVLMITSSQILSIGLTICIHIRKFGNFFSDLQHRANFM